MEIGTERAQDVLVVETEKPSGCLPPPMKMEIYLNWQFPALQRYPHFSCTQVGCLLIVSPGFLGLGRKGAAY